MLHRNAHLIGDAEHGPTTSGILSCVSHLYNEFIGEGIEIMYINILCECSTTLRSSSIHFKSKFTTYLAVASEVDLLLCIHNVRIHADAGVTSHVSALYECHTSYIYLIKRHERKGRRETELI